MLFLSVPISPIEYYTHDEPRIYVYVSNLVKVWTTLCRDNVVYDVQDLLIIYLDLNGILYLMQNRVATLKSGDLRKNRADNN